MPCHHRHDYDVLAGDLVGDEVEVDWNDVQTLAGGVRAARDWCMDNRDAVESGPPRE